MATGGRRLVESAAAEPPMTAQGRHLLPGLPRSKWATPQASDSMPRFWSSPAPTFRISSRARQCGAVPRIVCMLHAAQQQAAAIARCVHIAWLHGNALQGLAA